MDILDSDSEDDVAFYGGFRMNPPGAPDKNEGAGPAQKQRAQDYNHRKALSIRKYGEAPSRPHDDDRDFLMWRRKVNFGLKDSFHAAHSPNPLSLSLIPNTYRGGIIPPLQGSRLLFLDKSSIGSNLNWTGSLAGNASISLDLKFQEIHSYLGMICLVQIGTKEVDIIINATELHMLILNELKPVLEDHNKVKVVFGADDDFLNMKRDFGIQGQGFFDVQLFFHHMCLAGQIEAIMDLVPTPQAMNWFQKYFGYSFEQLSSPARIQMQRKKANEKKIAYDELVHLFYPGTGIDDAAQVADFRPRATKTFQELLDYARADVHYLLRIYILLKKIFYKFPDCFAAASKKTAEMAGKGYTRKEPSTADADFGNGISGLGKTEVAFQLSIQHKDIFHMIHSWRDQYARIMDEAPSRIISNQDLLRIILLKETISSPDDIPRVATSLKMENWIPILFRLLKEGEFRSETMKSICCGNCGLRGHISFGCYLDKNKEKVKANKKDHYNEHRDQKTWQNFRRQANTRLNQKKRNLEDLKKQLKKSTSLRRSQLENEIREKKRQISKAESHLEEKRKQHEQGL